jgi:Zn-dependent protease
VGATGLKIARIFGIPIYLHSSWFFIFLWIAYQFSHHPAGASAGWSQARHWVFGVLTALFFFASILFHELAHAVVAVRYKIPVESITLFIFGGVARIGRDPDRAIQEFLIASAGPAASYLLVGIFWVISVMSPDASMLGELGGQLATINFSLATFNLVPGFPLDGGRILRSIVWGVTGNYARATRIAARGGQMVALVLIATGLGIAVWFGMIGGLWLAFIGWFVWSAARMSYAQAGTRTALAGLRAADVMSQDLATADRAMSVEEYAQQVSRTGRRVHLVVSDGQLVGLMNMDRLQGVPRHDWPATSLQAAMLPKESLQWTPPETSALDVIDRMRRGQVEEIAVIDGGNVVGMVTGDSLRQVLETRDAMARLATR